MSKPTDRRIAERRTTVEGGWCTDTHCLGGCGWPAGENRRRPDSDRRRAPSSVVKNKSTPENRAFWQHVEAISKYVHDHPEKFTIQDAAPTPAQPAGATYDLLRAALPYVKNWMTANEDGWIEKSAALAARIESVLAAASVPVQPTAGQILDAARRFVSKWADNHPSEESGYGANEVMRMITEFVCYELPSLANRTAPAREGK